jgi:hypothetical protein
MLRETRLPELCVRSGLMSPVGTFRQRRWIDELPRYPARAARRSDCGGWPKARMKARRIRSGSRKPVDCATRSMASLEDCTRSLRRKPAEEHGPDFLAVSAKA